MQGQMERGDLKPGSGLESMDLAELAGDVVHTYQARVQEHRLHFEGGGTCRIWGNHGQLKRMLLNLLSNAIKQSAPEREVTVCVWRCGADVHLIVQDQGRSTLCAGGERLFLPFKPLEYDDTDQEAHGFLASIQSIIEAHGGDISIQGEPERGTAINVRFKACCHPGRTEG